MEKIVVTPLRWYEKVFDAFMIPFMYVASGTFLESPQRTHRWNNMKFDSRKTNYLDIAQMVHSVAVPASPRWFWKIPRFHIPIFGGWRHYVVLKPAGRIRGKWYVGWITGDACGVSRLRLRGPVRVLIGDDDVQHFGIDAHGNQVPLRKIGEGAIGQGGPFSWIPFH